MQKGQEESEPTDKFVRFNSVKYTKKAPSVRQTQHLLTENLVAAKCFGSYEVILRLYSIVEREKCATVGAKL
jgi:hypothetical protein